MDGGGGLVTKSGPTLVTPWTVACQLLCHWDFPGKNTGVGCHFLLQGIFPTWVGIEPGSPVLQADSLPTDIPGRGWIAEAKYQVLERPKFETLM